MVRGTSGQRYNPAAQQVFRYALHKHERVFDPDTPDRADVMAEAEAAGALLTRARKVLGLSVSDLAFVLGVSRPTIYAWMNGTEPRPETWTYLETLSDAANRARAWHLPRMSRLVRRPVEDGPSLLERLHNGENVDDTTFETLARLADSEQTRQLKRKGRGTPRTADEAAREHSRPTF